MGGRFNRETTMNKPELAIAYVVCITYGLLIGLASGWLIWG